MPAPQSDPAPWPGMNLDVLVEAGDTAAASRKSCVRELAGLRVAEKIGPPDAADEQQVAGEQARRLRRQLRRGPDVFRRMSRRVQEGQADIADLPLLAVAASWLS